MQPFISCCRGKAKKSCHFKTIENFQTNKQKYLDCVQISIHKNRKGWAKPALMSICIFLKEMSSQLKPIFGTAIEWGFLCWVVDTLSDRSGLELQPGGIRVLPRLCKKAGPLSLGQEEQARKARRCDSYLQIWNYQWPTHPLTDRGRCLEMLSHLKNLHIYGYCPKKLIYGNT